MNSQTALLLIDIQNDYFDGGANPLTGSLEASINAKKMLKFFREQKKWVIHVQHFSTRAGSTFFIPGTQGVEIHENVRPLENEMVIPKHFPNSYRETGLLEHLRSNSITHLVVCGMMTHMCVDATVRAAKDFGFECSLISDACATKDLSINGITIKAADVHHSFLAALNYYYASVINADEFIGKKVSG
jgi:nicotinamidase-related amidase